MKIDLHVHTKERSSCGRSTETEMLSAARRFGLDAIVFTEHNRLVPPQRLAELREQFAPLKIFGGIEISLTLNDHCIVIGVDDPELAYRSWTYDRLQPFVREREGWIALCHPFRMTDDIPLDIETRRPDAIEVHSVHTGADDEARIRGICEALGLTPVANSDAHIAPFVGIFYNEIPGDPATERELVEALRAGPVEVRADDARTGMLNRMIDERESIIRHMIESGVDAPTYCQLTGMSRTHYHRVLNGKSSKV